jgi:glutamate N-acetyltransferase / amino-acid N-acetyltransferase
MTTPIAPLAPAAFPEMPAVAGVRLATHHCGIKYKNRDETLLVALDEGTAVAVVATTSKTASAPVLLCRKNAKGGKARAILVNAGNSNAFTGKAGEKFVSASVKAVAKAVGCPMGTIFPASTGVIGVPMPEDLIAAHVPALAAKLGTASWQQAADAIRTTDTFAKGVYKTAKIGKTKVTICGIAKGSGMIAPDMATMLAYVFTDAAIKPALLQKLLKESTDRSFNAITVDGDTSTSDTLVLCATGQAGNKPIASPADPLLKDFKKQLDAALLDLAHQIVRDGEGATKFVEIRVKGAATDKAARKIGLTVANSPLVKTAIAGQDANWGRIVAAIGRAGEKADRDKLKIKIGGVLICAKGMQVPGYDETPVAQHMKGPQVEIDIDLGLSKGSATVWTCDLTHGYIDINADYRS